MLPEPLPQPSHVVTYWSNMQFSLGGYLPYKAGGKLKDWRKQGQNLTLTLNTDCPWASDVTCMSLNFLIRKDKMIIALATQ